MITPRQIVIMGEDDMKTPSLLDRKDLIPTSWHFPFIEIIFIKTERNIASMCGYMAEEKPNRKHFTVHLNPFLNNMGGLLFV